MMPIARTLNWGRLLPVAPLAAAVALLVGASPALAASASPGWSISSVAEPTNFSIADNAACENPPGTIHQVCDAYSLIARNVGGASSDGTPIVIKDTLPAGLVVRGIVGRDLARAEFEEEEAESEGKHRVECTVSPLQCVYQEPVAAGDAIQVTIEVAVAGSGSTSVMNQAEVEGGGALAATTSEPASVSNTINGPPVGFGVQDLDFGVYGLDGRLDDQAGDHPNSVTTSYDLNSVINAKRGEEYPITQSPKSVSLELPLGFIGNPEAAPQCPEYDLDRETLCPAASRIGTITVDRYGRYEYSGQSQLEKTEISDLYNMVPEKGYPAVFGFRFITAEVLLYARVVWTPEGYRVRVTVPAIPQAKGYSVNSASLTFFGDPAEADGSGAGATAFFRNPTDCDAPGSALSARLMADSWVRPEVWVEKTAQVYPQISGCDMLQFNAGLGVTPDTTQADEPAGYTVDLNVAQADNVAPLLGTPDLKEASLTLPPGVSISPSAADGLAACSDAQFGLQSTEPAACPAASQIATVTASTPILPQPLTGQVFLGAPQCGNPTPCSEADAREGRMARLFMQVAIPGTSLKFPGTVSVNTTTGQLTAHFQGLIQQPITDVKLQLKGGPRAPLANPQTCGTATSTSDLVPWSTPATADATPSSSFAVDWDGDGGACPSALPFAPSVSAGTVTAHAGAFSPFTFTVARHDREQDLSAAAVQLPPGVLGVVKGVPLCEEPQAAQGTCGAGSEIGTAHAAAGAGSHPFWTEGKVYLTGPYDGAPFGLSIVVPAVAGPFNLGTVVVRAAIHVDPATAALTIVSGALPQMLDGIPLRIQAVNVSVDRPAFTFNPTDCNQLQVTSTITSAQGATSSSSSPFAVAGCASLPFHPSFTVSTQAKTSKQNGASLDVKYASGAGQANTAKVTVSLPKALPSRLTTIQQACPEATFAQNPATCPAGSDIGTATVSTPILANSASGPVYLVSHGGAAFPNVVAILQAEGVTVDLTGSVDIKGAVTSAAFDDVPDVPIEAFEMRLPEGSHSALTAVLPKKAKGSMCGQSLVMPTTISGQNGAQIVQQTKIKVTGCATPKKKAKRAKGRKRHGASKQAKGHAGKQAHTSSGGQAPRAAVKGRR